MFSYLQIFPQKKLKFNKYPYLHHLSGFLETKKSMRQIFLKGGTESVRP